MPENTKIELAFLAKEQRSADTE